MKMTIFILLIATTCTQRYYSEVQPFLDCTGQEDKVQEFSFKCHTENDHFNIKGCIGLGRFIYCKDRRIRGG